jgi:FkbM family methyltransferase
MIGTRPRPVRHARARATIITRIRYYVSSVWTLARGVRNWPALPLLLIGQPVTLRLRDGSQFHARSLLEMWIVKETCLDDTYACSGRVPPDAVVMDIGAGAGDFAVWSATHLRARVVHAFEPHEASFALLQAHLALNVLTCVVPHRVAIGPRTGSVRLVVAAEPSQSRSVPSGAREGEPCAAWSLADAFDRCGVEQCDLLKLDCEGAEFSILLDADPDVLARVRQIRLEYHDGIGPRTHRDLMRALDLAGFYVSDRPSPVHGHLGILIADRR